ncbi:MAG: DUF3244 domain-containing protein [Bacteroides cellulosilyticus]
MVTGNQVSKLVIQVRKTPLKFVVLFPNLYVLPYIIQVVTIDFQTVFSTVTINITNETTGEIVSSELFINPTSFSIDLNGKDTGDYMIEIISNEISLEGHFSL